MLNGTRAVIQRKLRSVNINELNFESQLVVEARGKIEEVFGVIPCLWQLKVALATLKGDKHVVSVSRTGSGKTLTFWIPVILATDGYLIVVVPLNILGKQDVDQLTKAGIPSIVITGESASETNFQDIEKGTYRVIVTNPEILLRPGKTGFYKLLRSEAFASRIIALVLDEAHCISVWDSFRPEFKEIGRLRHVIESVRLHLTSATLPKHILNDVLNSVNIPRTDLFSIHRSNAQPNIAIVVREIRHSLTSFKDLDFIVDTWAAGGPTPGKFLILFDSINECVQAGLHLRSRLPLHLRDFIKWHNSDMTSEFRVEELEALIKGEVIGFCATDTLGMGMDISDFVRVYQWRVRRLTLCAMWQRKGRAARNLSIQAIFVLFVESRYFLKNQRASRASKRVAGINISQSRKRTRVDGSSEIDRHVDNAAGELETVPAQEGTGPEPMGSLGALFANRRRAYIEYQATLRRRSQAKGESGELDPALHDLINAREMGFTCRLQPAQIYFDEDRVPASDHDLCRPGGCTRCCPTPPSFCCDLSFPELIDLVFGPPPPVSRPRIPSPATVMSSTLPPPSLDAAASFIQPGLPASQENVQPKQSKTRINPYISTDKDKELRTALTRWRQQQTIVTHGHAILKAVGSALVLPNGVLDRIVDCAHYGVLGSMQDLRRELQWSRVDEFGEQVLELLKKIAPPPLSIQRVPSTQGASRQPLGVNNRLLNNIPIPPSLFYQDPRQLPSSATSVQQRSTRIAGALVPETAKPRQRCSQCKQQGHNKRTCPLLEGSIQIEKENQADPPVA